MQDTTGLAEQSSAHASIKHSTSKGKQRPKLRSSAAGNPDKEGDEPKLSGGGEGRRYNEVVIKKKQTRYGMSQPCIDLQSEHQRSCRSQAVRGCSTSHGMRYI